MTRTVEACVRNIATPVEQLRNCPSCGRCRSLPRTACPIPAVGILVAACRVQEQNWHHGLCCLRLFANVVPAGPGMPVIIREHDRVGGGILSMRTKVRSVLPSVLSNSLLPPPRPDRTAQKRAALGRAQKGLGRCEWSAKAFCILFVLVAKLQHQY